MKYLNEIMKELNDSPELAETTYKDNSNLKIVFFHAFNKAGKFNLPSGETPFKKHPAPLGMTDTNILWETNKLKIFVRTDLPPVKIEGLYISLLESIHPEEAEIMEAIKDQKLHKLYKKLNKKFAIANGYIVEELDSGEAQPLPV